MPSPYDLTSDERWSPDRELFREYDLELDDAVDEGCWNDAVVETTPDNEDDRDKIIDFSRMHQTPGDKVLSENNGSLQKISCYPANANSAGCQYQRVIICRIL